MTPRTADLPLGHGAAAADRARRGHATSRTRPTLSRLERNGQVVLRYCATDGSLSRRGEPERLGRDNIAGICNEGGNVFGLMPHPERAAEPELPSQDGRLLIGSLVGATQARPPGVRVAAFEGVTA